MSESKKGIHQIGPTSFLFFNSPEIFYSLSFEIREPSNIILYVIKIQPSETYLYQREIDHTILNTGDQTPQNTLKKLAYIIYNYNFIIKEERNKLNLILNSRTPVNVELLLFSQNENKGNVQNNLCIKEQMNKMQNTIQELLARISNQEQKLNEYKQKEEMYLTKISKIEQITSGLTQKMEQLQNNSYNSDNNNINTNNNFYSNNSANDNYYSDNSKFSNNNMSNSNNSNYYNDFSEYNNFSSNNQESNSIYGNNNNFGHKRAMTMKNIPAKFDNFGDFPSNTVYNPYIPENQNVNDLLTRPSQYNPPPQKNNYPPRTIDLDKATNMRKPY